MPVLQVDPKDGIQAPEPVTMTIKRLDGSEVEIRRVKPSKEALQDLGLRSHIDIIGHLGINPLHIERQVRIRKAELIRSMAAMTREEQREFIGKGVIDFADHDDLKRFDILCTNCGQKVAYCYAKNDKLDGWCDLHYLCSYDPITWYGCMAVNVSKIDNHLGFECACGEDTREYRDNQTLPPIQRQLMAEYSLKHREFGTPDSKFITLEADNG